MFIRTPFLSNKKKANKLFVEFCLVFMVFNLSGCLDMSIPDTNVSPIKSFTQKISVENYKKSYLLGDTLWFNGVIPDSMTNQYTGEKEKITNATFIFSGELYLLKPLYDSLRFLDNNFELLLSEGSLDYINVTDGNYSSYMFSIKFGKPVDNNKIRFGIVTNYLGAFSFETTAKVYYGAERTDYNDFTQDNELGYISLNFNLDNINSDVYYSLPAVYQQYYDSYYTYNAINAKQFYFINVIKAVE